jgi:guanosine-3',5'-bis(diphosphate) 3'-pyrophosphohydrolase
MTESRVQFLEKNLALLGYWDSLRALDLVVSEMRRENGFSRHNGSHYYYHLVDVTQSLINAGVRYQPAITAALLHDYVEDVEGVSVKLVDQLFGEEVARYVALLTKKPELDYRLPTNMKAYLDGIGEHVWTALIKTSDRKHNFSTLREASFQKRMKQAIETETYFIPAFKEWRNRFPRYAAYFFEAKTAIEPHLWAIKDYQTEIERLQNIIREANIAVV